MLLLMRGKPDAVESSSRWIALWTSLLVLGLAIIMWREFDPSRVGYQFEQKAEWLSAYGVTYHMGVDGISLLFVLLTALITVVSILASWHLIIARVRDYMVAVLLLETTLMGLFSALDLVVFYVFYEATLIPSCLLIGVWGGTKRVYASVQFFLFTFGGSLLMLLALIGAWVLTGTTDIPTLLHAGFSPPVQAWMFWCFIVAFGVKLPLFPLHAWLPGAYGEAPAPVSALVSGVLSKAGAYGLLRFCLMLLPDASHRFAPCVLVIAVVGIIYAAIVALAQVDMKRVIAYSSFSHMGLIAVGLFTLTPAGISGAVFQMLSHGVIITALFLGVAMISYRVKTRDISSVGGLARSMPVLAVFAMLFAMANIGLPGTGAFVGEFLVMVGAIHVSFWLALFGGSAMILGAVYMLVLYRRTMFGQPVMKLSGVRDITMREVAILLPLALITLWMGVYPSSFTKMFEPAVSSISSVYVAQGAQGRQVKVALLPR